MEWRFHLSLLGLRLSSNAKTEREPKMITSSFFYLFLHLVFSKLIDIYKSTFTGHLSHFFGENSMFTITVLSFSGGICKFNGRHWFRNNIVTRYPPKDGTCEVRHNDNVLFRGDTSYLLETIHRIPGLREIFPDRMW